MPVTLCTERFLQQLRMKRCCGNDRLSKHTVSLSTGHGPAVFWVFVAVKAGFFFFLQRRALKSDDGVPVCWQFQLSAGETIVKERYYKASPNSVTT